MRRLRLDALLVEKGLAASRERARALVLDDGRQRLAIVLADSCMMPRTLLDEAKQLAAQRTKVRADRMLIAATHSHSAPSSMGCLGTDARSSGRQLAPAASSWRV